VRWHDRLEAVTGVRVVRRIRDAVAAWADAHHIDGVDYLTVFLVLLFGVPASLVLSPLGAAGTPAGLIAVLGTGCWVLDRLAGSDQDRLLDRQRFGLSGYPVRTVGSVFVLAVLASYIAAMSRPITGTEVNSIHVGLIRLVGWSGLVLIVADGAGTQRQLGVLVQRLATGAGVCGAIGILQFLTGRTLTDRLSIPGLSVNTLVPTVGDRDGLSRAIGTTIQPIEFGVAMAIMLPLCIHVGRYGAGGPLRRWWPTAAVGLAVPAANSRSGFLALLAVLVVIFPLWPAVVRLRALVVGTVGLGCVFLLVHGMLGTIINMFQGLSNNPTTTSRTGSYELGWSFIQRAPLFGRGFMTFLPPYRVIDNQYLGLLIDTGIVGTLALLALFLTGFGAALSIRRRAMADPLVSLAASLAATIAGLVVSFAFFDALAFPTVAALTALSLGLVDALWRIVRDQRVPAPAQQDQSGSRSPWPKNASTAAHTR
jgi:O-antigen ligase